MSTIGRIPGGGRGETPRRVRVTSPRQSARRRAPARSLSTEIDEQTGLGEVYVDSLVRAQLRLSMSVLAGLVLLLGGPPLAFALWPNLLTVAIGPMTLPWLLLAALLYPLGVVVARAYVRAAERVERDFEEVLRRR